MRVTWSWLVSNAKYRLRQESSGIELTSSCTGRSVRLYPSPDAGIAWQPCMKQTNRHHRHFSGTRFTWKPNLNSKTANLFTIMSTTKTPSKRVFPPLYTPTCDSLKDKLAFIHLLEKLKVCPIESPWVNKIDINVFEKDSEENRMGG